MTIAHNQALTLAKQFNIQGDAAELVDTLKATAFRGNATDAQFNALLIVATQYSLNPFTSEIYAFPSKGGITPVVGVDGWARIINANPQFDGMEFVQDADSCTCRIYRKDRTHPISVTEWMDECQRDTQPWKSHPKRMLRHKAMIQAARLAFGFAGIYDEDEGERIKNAKDGVSDGAMNPFAGKIDSAQRESLVAEGESAANNGMDAYRDWFKSIGKEGREILGSDEHARMKSLAEAANVIEAEYSEVPL